MAKFIQDEEEEQHHYKKIGCLSKQITKVAALVAVVMLLMKVFSWSKEFLTLITSVTIAVAIIPEKFTNNCIYGTYWEFRKWVENAIVKKLFPW